GRYSLEYENPTAGDAFSVDAGAFLFLDESQAIDPSQASIHFDAALHRAPTVAGHVRTDDGRVPAVGYVTLSVFLNGIWSVADQSDVADDGSFVSQALAPGSYRVCAGGTAGDNPPGTFVGTRRQCFNHVDQQSAEEPDFTPVVVSADEERIGVDFDLSTGGRVSGHIIDGHTSAPLQVQPFGWHVYLHVYDSNGVEWRPHPSADEQADGTYAIDGLPEGVFYLAAQVIGPFSDGVQIYPGISCDYGNDQCIATLGEPLVVAAGSELSNIDFTFHPAAMIHGRVIDSLTGSGIEGAKVTSTYARYDPFGTNYIPEWTTLSQADGSYEVYASGSRYYYLSAEHLAPWINTLHPAVSCAGIFMQLCFPDGTPVLVAPDSTQENVDIAATLGGGIEGRMSSLSSGEPVLAQVSITVMDTYIRFDSSYASDGRYRSDGIPAGTYVATAGLNEGTCSVYADRPCPSDAMPLRAVDPTPIVLQTGVIESAIDFHLPTDTLFISSFGIH
ncbi:MAG: hypothetical protein ABIR62_15860, partial [Dokdonella sp.]|uniref:MSCRAMM family protein n=1 Tax=Dokdonella sp. TaxID=2291710 RepID=UPI0032635A35